MKSSLACLVGLSLLAGCAGGATPLNTGGEGGSGGGGTVSTGGASGGAAGSSGGAIGSGGIVTSSGGAGGGSGGAPGGRMLDLVVMVDNSPWMAPKIAKLNVSFPKLIDALKHPTDGTLPDLRVAIIDSDLGTGCAYSSGACGPKDPSAGTGCYGDQGKFQVLQFPTECNLNPGAQFLEVKNNVPVNFPSNTNVSQVFSCLASNLGTLGCGFEHQLQAFEFALVAKGIGNEEQQAAFLRSSALLGLVFLTDEDDCSAATNDGMFGDLPGLRGESAFLRCATRGHRCGGQNLSTSGPSYPTTASYSHAFSDCEARLDDACPNPTDGTSSTPYDTSAPTSCSPLKDVRRMAAEIKSLKPDPQNQIVVGGIFGWPLTDEDLATAQYKVAPVPNLNTADPQHPQVYQYWPICYDPEHQPAAATTDAATGFDQAAADWGAMGGLRNAAFVDQFGDNGLKFSICERNFIAAMTAIGTAMAKKLP